MREGYHKGEVAIEVRITVDPEGDLALLLQLPNGWVLMDPDEAREVARMLTLSAEDYEDVVDDYRANPHEFWIPGPPAENS